MPKKPTVVISHYPIKFSKATETMPALLSTIFTFKALNLQHFKIQAHSRTSGYLQSSVIIQALGEILWPFEFPNFPGQWEPSVNRMNIIKTNDKILYDSSLLQRLDGIEMFLSIIQLSSAKNWKHHIRHTWFFIYNYIYVIYILYILFILWLCGKNQTYIKTK